jgi:hypothetical protein
MESQRAKSKRDSWVLDDGCMLVPFNKVNKMRTEVNGMDHLMLTMLNFGCLEHISV